jgi:hypothetical protein
VGAFRPETLRKMCFLKYSPFKPDIIVLSTNSNRTEGSRIVLLGRYYRNYCIEHDGVFCDNNPFTRALLLFEETKPYLIPLSQGIYAELNLRCHRFKRYIVQCS